MADSFSRRDFIHLTLGVAGATLLGCKSAAKELSCTDVSALSEQDRMLRNALVYIEKSPHADKNCTNCLQYVAGAPDACGTCKVVKGPIHPAGYCNSWVVKPA